MTQRLIVRGGDIVTPDRVVRDGAILVEDGRIAEISEGPLRNAGADVREVRGLIAPGFVDLHSDALEREIRPRPNALIPLDVALGEFDRKLALHGITTMLHAIALTEEDGPRSRQVAEVTIDAIRRRRDVSLVRHFVHARYEITDVGVAPEFHALLDRGDLQMISFMDHTPGSRQFRTREAYVEYFSRAYAFGEEATQTLVDKKLRRKQHEHERIDEILERLARAAQARGVTLASHDDDSADRVSAARALGAAIAEFPVTAEAATAAKAAGLHVVMGAPNVLRGRSASGNLSALESLRLGALDSLCSDYYPGSMLHATYRLINEKHASVADAFRLVTLNPARAAGLDHVVGSLEVGKAADLIVIEERDGLPVITRAFRDGREILAVA